VHDFAVGALAGDEEFELGAGEGEVAEAVDGVEGVEGVAAEEPAEAGAGAVSAGVVAGYEGCFLRAGVVSLVRRFGKCWDAALSCSMEITPHWKASLRALSGVSMEVESESSEA
jgi:hypothetical protein